MHRLAGDRAGMERAPAGEVEEAGGDAVAEPAAAEVARDPHRAVGGLDQHVDVVVPGADRSELLLGARAQRPRPPPVRHLLAQLGHLRPCRRVEERVLDPGGVLAAHAEADPGGALVGDPRQVGANVVDMERRAHGHHAAADVVADAARRHHLAVGGDAADRHGVADMVVGHERRLGHPAVAGDGRDLGDRLRVVRIAVDPEPAVQELAVGALLDDHRATAIGGALTVLRFGGHALIMPRFGGGCRV